MVDKFKMIPQRLQQNQFRFIKVRENKAPIEEEWTTKNNYLYYEAERFIEKDKRYGIVTGYGNLLVIDFDKKEIQDEILPKLPETFMTKSAGKGLLHLYYIVDKPESFKVLDLNKETLADIQGEGKQVIGPGSILKNKEYTIAKDIDIARLDIAEIKGVFSKWINLENNINKSDRKEVDKDCEKIKEKIKIPDLLQEWGIDTTKNPTSCPLHSSQGGRCFSYNENVWHCFHCEQKGNIFHLYMTKNSCNFIQAKKDLAAKVGITLKKRFVGEVNILDYVKNAEKFYESQAFFYDKSGLFWFWNHDEHKYELWDDVDVMKEFDDRLGLDGVTVNSKLKTHYMEAFKRVGRGHLPAEAPKKWVQFKDKAYSIESGNIYEITPDYFFTNPIPWEIGESENTPVLDKLFEEWVGSEYVETLYEIIAYCCYRDYPIQVLFCLVGSGRNGKSCYQRLINAFFGNKNICSTELDTLLDSRFESFKLYTKLVCSMGETNFGILAKTSLLKKLVGGDCIGYEKKNKDPFNGYNYAKILIASNSLPTSTDTSEGFYRRWLIIEFPNQFQEGKDILESIPLVEYNNLAKKCLNKLKNLLEKGSFTNLGDPEERKNKYIMASNPLPVFLYACCNKEEDAFVGYNELYTAYVKFLHIHKKRRVKMKEFRSSLEDEGFWIERTTKGDDFTKKSGNWVVGLELKHNWKDMIYVNSVKKQLFPTQIPCII